MLTALLAEYQRATIDLKIVLEMLSQAEYNLVRDEKTRDPDCRSIKTVVTHILNSGYVYANYLNTVNKRNSVIMIRKSAHLKWPSLRSN